MTDGVAAVKELHEQHGRPLQRRMVQPAWDLKYLFAAHFADGSEIIQTPADQSVLEPGVRSAYFDVERRVESGIPLVSFALFNDAGVFAVDLRDGHFEVKVILPTGGVLAIPFTALPTAAPHLPPGGTFSLIYFRDHQQDIISSREGSTLGEHRHSYRLGWRYGEHAQTIVVV
jgi:hypothetical protein